MSVNLKNYNEMQSIKEYCQKIMTGLEGKSSQISLLSMINFNVCC